MKAPDNIYVHEANAHELTEELPHHIEYVRADAFIEKAEEYLNEHFDCTSESDCGYVISGKYSSMEDFIEDFKNYMKG